MRGECFEFIFGCDKRKFCDVGDIFGKFFGKAFFAVDARADGSTALCQLVKA